jgi:uncharacterized membrane protein
MFLVISYRNALTEVFGWLWLARGVGPTFLFPPGVCPKLPNRRQLSRPNSKRSSRNLPLSRAVIPTSWCRKSWRSTSTRKAVSFKR